ncbi:hypothetical protein GGR54DRAFT_615821 [Hypoxylon sp. NC1633]|nr:hypothetical protein GGR54DRAFT_615821 [Hypoxylon sp. NC1633]
MPIPPDESDPYLLHLASKNKYEDWMQDLKEIPRRSHMLIGHIIIINIHSSGTIDDWVSDPDHHDLSEKLKDLKPINGTRLIAFHPASRVDVQYHAGVLYDVDPTFFRAVQMSCDIDGKYSDIHNLEPNFLAGSHSQYLDLGYGWTVQIIRCNDNNNVVIVSAPLINRYPNPLAHLSQRSLYEPQMYSCTFSEALLRRDKDFYVKAHKNPLILLLPLLEIHAIYLYDSLVWADRMFRRGRRSGQDGHDLVENAWDTLRMLKHDGMRPLDCFLQYDKDHNQEKAQASEEYQKSGLAERFVWIKERISLTEELARDYIQVPVGLLSLKASHASIKESKIALEESKRTKLITVLAIFFVPISLSTSIFGMNINELNENGQPLWVFITTTASIVAATLMVWGFMYQLQKYNLLLLRKRDTINMYPWKHGWGLILQLVFRGHIIWVWKSGILFSLLTNGRMPFLRSCLVCHEHDPTNAFGGHDAHNPSRYISTHLGRGLARAFESYKLEANH